MTNLRLSNKTSGTLTIMIEPIASTFDVIPNQSADIRMTTSPDLINIDVHTDNFVSVWTTGDTQVVVGGELFRL